MTNEFGIAELVDRLGRIAHTLQYTGGLNPAQWEALRFLARANRYSCTPTALAEFLGTTKGTVSQTLIALESKGYVRRTRGRTDRRSVDLALTDEGREMLRNDPIGLIERVGDELPPPVRQALTDGMGSLLKSLNQAQQHPAFGVCADCNYCHQAGGESRSAAPCYCGLANDPLTEEDTHLICVDFIPAQQTT